MANETEKLRVAPDLVDRVLRASRQKKTNRVRLTALATAVAVAGAVVPVYLVLGPNSVAVQGFGLGEPVAASETPRPDATGQAVPDPPHRRLPAHPSPTPDLGDLGDGRAFGRVEVGYLPAGLQWSHWSLDLGDSYTTSWNYDGDKKGFYCVQIFVYEGQTVREVDERVRAYREEKEGRDVTIGDRTGYLLRQWVGEDGMKGTPSIFLSVGEGRTVEVMFSSTFAKRLGGDRTVDRELKKIAAGLTATG